MELPLDLKALSPADRARVIYTQARSEVSARLWQAALGRSPEEGEAGQGLRAGGFGTGALGTDLNGLLTSMGGGHICHCDHAGEGDVLAAETEGFVLPGVGGGSDPIVPAPATTTRSPLGGLGPNAVHADALKAASGRTRIPAATLAAIVDAEAAKSSDGSWKLYSRNPRSSAAGLGQFLNGTWIEMAQREGTWLNETARARGWLTESGKVERGARGALLSLRYDAQASINTIADYARINIDRLRRSGVAIGDTPAALADVAYLAHHLGPGDAARFLGGGLDEGRARVLLDAQIGKAGAAGRIRSAGGSAALAHRQWLTGYIDRNIRPERYML